MKGKRKLWINLWKKRPKFLVKFVFYYETLGVKCASKEGGSLVLIRSINDILIFVNYLRSVKKN